MKNTPFVKLGALLLLLLLMDSCLGVSADIAFNQNGSGTITLEYRISKSLDSLGKLDGNERWNTIPVGKADFERTLDRLPKMKLLSYTSKEDAKDLIVTVKMEFQDMSALLAFMDASGRKASFSGNAGSGSLVLTLNEGAGDINSGLAQLISGISEGYSIRMGISFPNQGSLALTDTNGQDLTAPPGAAIQSPGKTVSCSIPLYQVLSAQKGMKIVVSWSDSR